VVQEQEGDAPLALISRPEASSVKKKNLKLQNVEIFSQGWTLLKREWQRFVVLFLY